VGVSSFRKEPGVAHKRGENALDPASSSITEGKGGGREFYKWESKGGISPHDLLVFRRSRPMDALEKKEVRPEAQERLPALIRKVDKRRKGERERTPKGRQVP